MAPTGDSESVSCWNKQYPSYPSHPRIYILHMHELQFKDSSSNNPRWNISYLSPESSNIASDFQDVHLVAFCFDETWFDPISELHVFLKLKKRKIVGFKRELYSC